jgi:hypothetical protein
MIRCSPFDKAVAASAQLGHVHPSGGFLVLRGPAELDA